MEVDSRSRPMEVEYDVYLQGSKGVRSRPMEVEKGSVDSLEVAVYLKGHYMGEQLVYRVIVPMKGIRIFNYSHPMALQKIYPVLRGPEGGRGEAGSWTVIGDTIYCIGGFDNSNMRGNNLCKDLLKHRVYHTKPCPHTHSIWETESSWIMPRLRPFFAALGTNKLCVLSGKLWRDRDRLFANKPRRKVDSDSYKKCGAIYNVETKCWSLLDADEAAFAMYDTVSSVAVMEKDGEEPTQIMFYSLYTGAIQVLDLATNGTSKPPEFPADFRLKGSTSIPRGLKDHDDFPMLQHVTDTERAVFANGTFYWFTPPPVLRLYGYDTHTQTWRQSPSLKHEFPFLMPYDFDDPHLPILMYSPDGTGRLLVTLPECYGVLIMAFLTVDKQENVNSLNVSVELVQRVRFDNMHFWPRDGKAVLLNNTR